MKKILLSLGLMCLSSYANAEVMYIQSSQAKVMAAPTFKAAEVAVLKRATAVDVIEKDKRWIKVHYQDVTGWVSKLLLSTQAPLEKASVLTGDNEDLQSKARRRASSSSSAAATRGLRDSGREHTTLNDSMNYPGVEKMEAAAPNRKETESFLKDMDKQ